MGWLGMLYRLGLSTRQIPTRLTDVSTASSVYIVAPCSGYISRIEAVLEGAITVANATITVTTETGAISNTLTIAYSGSAAGSTFAVNTTNQANRKVLKGEGVKVETNGGSTDAAGLGLLVNFEPELG